MRKSLESMGREGREGAVRVSPVVVGVGHAADTPPIDRRRKRTTNRT